MAKEEIEVRAIYNERPEAVSVCVSDFGADIFLRRDIEEATIDEETGQVMYACEEVQGRVPEAVAPEEVLEDFGGWWERLEQLSPSRPPTTEEQLAQLRADVDFLLWGVWGGGDLF